MAFATSSSKPWTATFTWRWANLLALSHPQPYISPFLDSVYRYLMSKDPKGSKPLTIGEASVWLMDDISNDLRDLRAARRRSRGSLSRRQGAARRHGLGTAADTTATAIAATTETTTAATEPTR
jgi:hypothetical protein